ncbi:uncharacterized protein LOC100367292 [Saccoglossus kowalevskii]|uniref:Leucine-rich repeat-containing protein 63-like n=1 Tax=Saccoglossus kowalevskii TaxID=10224 RepID=A0ABM0MYA9_SACKO|nr:PREDICTED: leucine-rich repeat-containing protein 63-like [Saccoglossus kowalevskii]
MAMAKGMSSERGPALKPKGKGLLRRPLAPVKPKDSVYLKDFPTDTVEMYLASTMTPDTRDQLSPIPSVAPSLASGFHESDIKRRSSSKKTDQYNKTYPRSPMNTVDSVYLLEAQYRPKTEAATFTSTSLIKPYKPRGPDGLPPRLPKQNPEIKHEFLYTDSCEYLPKPEFTLEDFLLDHNEIKMMPKKQIHHAMLSKQNFKKLTTLFATFNKLPRQEKVNTLELKTDSIPKATQRVPQRQLLIEMTYILKQHMKDIMVYDMHGLMPADPILPIDYPDREALFTSPNPKYFQGSRRSQSPFFEEDQSNMITPSELAILDSLVNGGKALSLKAHFIEELPDVSVLYNTLLYLNLSFNDLRVFPAEILNMRNLEVLKLRNNPIKEIPHDIYKLKQLNTLVISYNQISSLPMSLYTLPLVFLDVSYNKIKYLPNEIKQLHYIRELNLEGNQLAALPSNALKFRYLRYLKVKNNFMHPLFWKENSTNQPQRLSDMAALIVKQRRINETHQRVIPDNINHILNSQSVCDCCKGPMYGSGLRQIRPCSKAFGIRNLPFYFMSCSPYCSSLFMKSTESLSELLYEDESEEDIAK